MNPLSGAWPRAMGVAGVRARGRAVADATASVWAHPGDGAESGGIGPKAASLRALAAAGLPVPEARFLGTDAYREHAARVGVADALAGSPEPGLHPASIREAMIAAPLDAGVEALLRRWFDELGGRAVAVRSSADAEDLPGMSFAGQHGTYFVSDVETLLHRVRDCWASLFSERAVRYRERCDIPHYGVSMGVIVQRLVPAVAAGVVFTADPLDGSPGVFLEACLGIGEGVVSGKVEPDRYVFSREGGALTLADLTLGAKHVRITARGGGCTVMEESVPAAEAAAPAVDESTARAIAEFALRAEDMLGAPADVEWAFDGARVWILQARPVTTISRLEARREAPFARDAAAASEVVWSNVNVGEILPDVVTPMTWSIVYGHVQDIFGGMFDALGVRIDARELVGLVGGRAYFNVSLMRDSLAGLPGMDLGRVLGGMQELSDLPDAPPPSRGRIAVALGLARTFGSLPAYVLRHTPARAERFAAAMRRDTDSTLAELARTGSGAEAHEVLSSMIAKFDEFNDTLAFMMTAMLGFSALGGLCRAWLGDETGALANRLVAGTGAVASAESGLALWGLGALARDEATVRDAVLADGGWDAVCERLMQRAEDGDLASRGFLASWGAFMAEHGHHRRGELEFANPTWAERPDYVLGIVRDYVRRDPSAEDPVAAYERRAAEAHTAAEDCRARLRGPLARAVFERALAWGRASARSRENVKSEAVRWLAAIRRALLAVGDGLVDVGVLERREDVFFLRADEIERAACAGDPPESVRELVAARRAEHERFSRLAPPPVVIGEWDGRDSWDAGPSHGVLRGISVSAGVVRGPARVFSSVDVEERVLPGEILVAPFTDPGWTPYFVPAAGIVMDMGGLLSHGSIIAREYGIPAVVNVGPATRMIATGQMIEVDGDRGEVRVLG